MAVQLFQAWHKLVALICQNSSEVASLLQGKWRNRMKEKACVNVIAEEAEAEEKKVIQTSRSVIGSDKELEKKEEYNRLGKSACREREGMETMQTRLGSEDRQNLKKVVEKFGFEAEKRRIPTGRK